MTKTEILGREMGRNCASIDTVHSNTLFNIYIERESTAARVEGANRRTLEFRGNT